jgi:hypothetical protein
MSVRGGFIPGPPPVMIASAALDAAGNKQVYKTGSSLIKFGLAVPIATVSVILLIAALIAVGNGAYTIGTFITFLIGACGFAFIYWLFSGVDPADAPPPQQFQQQQFQQQPQFQQQQQPQFQQQYQQPQYQQQPWQQYHPAWHPQAQYHGYDYMQVAPPSGHANPAEWHRAQLSKLNVAKQKDPTAALHQKWYQEHQQHHEEQIATHEASGKQEEQGK